MQWHTAICAGDIVTGPAGLTLRQTLTIGKHDTVLSLVSPACRPVCGGEAKFWAGPSLLTSTNKSPSSAGLAFFISGSSFGVLCLPTFDGGEAPILAPENHEVGLRKVEPRI